MKKIKKIFLIVFSFGPSRCLPIEEAIRSPGNPHCTLTIEYTFIRYVTWAGAKPQATRRYAKTHLPHMVSAGHKVVSDPETDSEISGCYGYGDDKPRL